MVPRINCDQVFDILTRGPFPGHSPADGDVEDHLLVCHDCRHLAEALRPAVGLIHEAIHSEERHKLPGYHGQLRVARDQLMTRVSTSCIEATRAPSAPPRSASRSGRAIFSPFTAQLAIAPLLMIALGTMLYGALSRTWSDGENDWLRTFQNTPRTEVEACEQLASLSLPAACSEIGWPAHASDPRASDAARNPRSFRDYHCCTQCHAAAYPSRPRMDDLAKLALACGACHHNL